MPGKGGKPTVTVFDTNMSSKRRRVAYPCRVSTNNCGYVQSETTLPVANGRPLHRDFLSLHECVAYLTDEALSDFVVDEVPCARRCKGEHVVPGETARDGRRSRRRQVLGRLRRLDPASRMEEPSSA